MPLIRDLLSHKYWEGKKYVCGEVNNLVKVLWERIEGSLKSMGLVKTTAWRAQEGG